jgi:hypothetical protein
MKTRYEINSTLKAWLEQQVQFNAKSEEFFADCYEHYKSFSSDKKTVPLGRNIFSVQVRALLEEDIEQNRVIISRGKKLKYKGLELLDS